MEDFYLRESEIFSLTSKNPTCPETERKPEPAAKAPENNELCWYGRSHWAVSTHLGNTERTTAAANGGVTAGLKQLWGRLNHLSERVFNPPLLILSWLCEPAQIRCFLSRSRLLEATVDPPLPPCWPKLLCKAEPNACGFATCNWIEALRLCCSLPVNWREYKSDTHVHTCSRNG